MSVLIMIVLMRVYVHAAWYVNIDLRATEYKIELFFNFVQVAFRKPPVSDWFWSRDN